jgi:hypothetical protein
MLSQTEARFAHVRVRPFALPELPSSNTLAREIRRDSDQGWIDGWTPRELG